MRCRDVGPPDAKIVLIGEAPGAEEERAGIPFVGAAGLILKQMLSHSGIDYNQCYVTNVMDVRPPGNQFKYFYDGKTPSRELEAGWTKLRSKVEAIKPDVIIPLGKEPLKAICNKDGIVDWRGTWLSFRGINVLPTYHPSYVLRVYKDHPIVEMDFTKAITRKPAEEPAMILRPTVEYVINWIDIALNIDRISFDIETVGKHIRCLAIASKPQECICGQIGCMAAVICIPFIKFPSSELMKPAIGSKIVRLSGSGNAGSYWTPAEELAVLDAISKLFMSGIEVVGQNSICFDEPLLRAEFGLSIKNHYLDTMHAFHCLYPEFPMSLNFLTSIYTDYPNYWSEKDTNNDMSEWKYNCMDAIVTLDVSYDIEKELNEVTV